ncbi:MAG TPA: HD domain-containing phosphohydrolase [Terriglobia bacterium]|nr:HD domain-containing phosphohydrolase [Terriglobia bacterium]
MSDGKYIARALIVDDERAVCELLRERFQQENYDCSICLNGEEAVAALHRQRYDVILSDLRMPRMSGLDFLERAKAECPHAAFILVTGEHDVRVGVEAIKNGASDYVVKPFKLDEVFRRVTSALEKKRLETEVEQYRERLELMVEERTRQLQKALDQIEETYDQTLEALGAALDLRDASTAGHSSRVTRYALAVARAMDCSADELHELTRGAYLHDIGKIGIPDGILLKDGPLTRQEQEVMRSHVSIGYQLVKRISFLSPAAEIVLAHQERYDGLGYPLGLRGEDIPLGARIFAVADTFDAMTSDRPYRRALPCETAFEEIQREAGHQFDPEVVRVFLSLPQSTWEEIRDRATHQPWPSRPAPSRLEIA